DLPLRFRVSRGDTQTMTAATDTALTAP
ncbi:hypothetical protein SAMN06264365_1371, partial [Actinoplanes regularis]